MHHITNARLVRDINTWLVASGLPMKPNQPKKPISDKYKKEVKDTVKHPNVNKIKGRRLAQKEDWVTIGVYADGDMPEWGGLDRDRIAADLVLTIARQYDPKAHVKSQPTMSGPHDYIDIRPEYRDKIVSVLDTFFEVEAKDSDFVLVFVSPGDYFGNPYLEGFPMESRKTAANYTIEVIDTLNDEVVQNIRGDDNPEDRFQKMLDKYGDRLDQYVIQLLKDGKIVKDTQGLGGTIRDFNARRRIAMEFAISDRQGLLGYVEGKDEHDAKLNWLEENGDIENISTSEFDDLEAVPTSNSEACLKRTMRRLRAQQEEMFDKDVYEDKPRSKTIGEVLASIKDKWVNYGDVDYLTHGGIQLKWDGGEGVEFIDFGYSEDGWWGYTGGDVDIGSMMENYQNLMNAYGSFENIPITEIIWDKSAREVIRYAGGEEIPEDEEDAIGSLWSLLLGYPSYWGGSEERILRAEEIAEELSELSGIEISAKDVAKDLLTNEQYEALEEVGIEMSEFVEQKIRNMLPKDLDID